MPAASAERRSPNCPRKRLETGKKVAGRKSHAELWPEVVAEARRLRRAKGKAGRLSYRQISTRLKDAGYCNERGQPFNPQSDRAMIEGPQPRQRRASDAKWIEHDQGGMSALQETATVARRAGGSVECRFCCKVALPSDRSVNG
jgi:hypothetical protein